jgi:hypothetical protein
VTTQAPPLRQSRDTFGGEYFETKGTKVFFQKSRNHLKIPGIPRVIQNNLHAQDPEILETTAQKLGARNLCTALFKKVLVSETNFDVNQF